MRNHLLASRAVQIRIGLIKGAIIALALFGCSRNNTDYSRKVSGTIETDQVRIASRYGGRVEKIWADEGQALKGGEVVVELDAAELRARRDQAAAQLAEMEAGPRKEEIEAAKHDWEALVAEFEQARADAQRAEELFSKKTISATEHDQAVARARMLEKNGAAARSRYDLLLAGTR